MAVTLDEAIPEVTQKTVTRSSCRPARARPANAKGHDMKENRHDQKMSEMSAHLGVLGSPVAFVPNVEDEEHR
jgi:hypothetical protein